MAESFVRLPPDSNGKRVRAITHMVGGQTVHTHTMVPVDPDTGDPLDIATEAKQDALVSAVTRPFDGFGVPYVNTVPSGTWAYRAGSSGTPTFPSGARILSFTAAAGDDPATATINGGDSIIIPANRSFSFTPEGVLVDPTISFAVTETYFVEFVS